MGLKTKKRDVAKRVFFILLAAILLGAAVQKLYEMKMGSDGSWADVLNKANAARSDAKRLKNSVEGGSVAANADENENDDSSQEDDSLVDLGKSKMMALAEGAEVTHENQDKIQYNEVMSGLFSDPKWNEATKIEKPKPRDPKKAKKYSRHQCIGQRFDAEEPRVSSCVYRDICFDPNVGTFRYYKDPKETIKEPQHGGLFRAEIPPGGRGEIHGDMRVSLGVANRGHQPPFLDGFYWKPEAVNEAIPLDALQDPAPLSVLYMHYHGHNFGHMLFDEAHPLTTHHTPHTTPP
jgi:hypothetical protein